MDPRFIIERQGRPMVLYAGLLNEATERGLQSIEVTILQVPSDANGQMAVATATVTMADGRVFQEIGDATPANVGPNIRGHILRMSATRAKARALRDAVNVGMVAVEEVGDDEEPSTRTNGRPPVEPAQRNGWAVIWERWSALAAQAQGAGVPAPALTPITEDMTRDQIARRIEELKIAIAKAGEVATKPASGGGVATQAQAKAIYAIGKNELKLEVADVDAISQGRYGGLPAGLTKNQASDFLDHLRSLTKPASDADDLPF